MRFGGMTSYRLVNKGPESCRMLSTPTEGGHMEVTPENSQVELTAFTDS